jgi:hypothetical protein
MKAGFDVSCLYRKSFCMGRMGLGHPDGILPKNIVMNII